MDSTPAQTVAYGTLITSGIAAFVTGVYGVFKRNSGWLAAAAAVNSGITAATFFTIREYVVTPTLSSGDKTAEPQSKIVTDRSPWLEWRMRKLLDSSISGGITGGLLYGGRRGWRGILPGITTGSIACAILQWAYNETSIARIKYIRSQSLQESTDRAIPHIHMPHQYSLEPPQSFQEKTMKLLGLNKLSDDEYLKKLKRVREAYIQQIDKLERQEESSRQSAREQK